MRKFKLIKKYKCIPKKINIGDTVFKRTKSTMYYEYIKKDLHKILSINEVENNPGCWEEITEEENTLTIKFNLTPDKIVQSVIHKINDRSKDIGIKKYGTTLDSNDSLSIIDWINHAQEEGMDKILYLEKLKSEITKLLNKVTIK